MKAIIWIIALFLAALFISFDSRLAAGDTHTLRHVFDGDPAGFSLHSQNRSPWPYWG